MRNTILAGVAALALAIPAIAQDATVEAETTATTPAATLTAAQQAQYDGWPADRQMAYDKWPADVQGYYWTLTPQQVEGWWALTDAQRVQVFQMTPEQRVTAWTSITAQLAGGPPPTAAPAPAATAAPMGTAASTASASASMPASASMASTAATSTGTVSGNVRFVRGEVAQTAPAATPGAEYPPCRGEVTDGCVNPREAGLNYGNRPLNYWPGRPASEIDGPLPAQQPTEPAE